MHSHLSRLYHLAPYMLAEDRPLQTFSLHCMFHKQTCHNEKKLFLRFDCQWMGMSTEGFHNTLTTFPPFVGSSHEQPESSQHVKNMVIQASTEASGFALRMKQRVLSQGGIKVGADRLPLFSRDVAVGRVSGLGKGDEALCGAAEGRDGCRPLLSFPVPSFHRRPQCLQLVQLGCVDALDFILTLIIQPILQAEKEGFVPAWR